MASGGRNFTERFTMAVSDTMLLNAFLGHGERKLLLCELILHVTVSLQWFPFLLKGEIII